jgi:hypothetical protein
MLRVFENRVVRGIFGVKREEVTGHWKQLHNEELHDVNCSPDIIMLITSRTMRWGKHVACMGQRRYTYRVLVGKPEGNRSLGKPRRMW